MIWFHQKTSFQNSPFVTRKWRHNWKSLQIYVIDPPSETWARNAICFQIVWIKSPLQDFHQSYKFSQNIILKIQSQTLGWYKFIRFEPCVEIYFYSFHCYYHYLLSGLFKYHPLCIMTHFKIEVRSLCKGGSKILTSYRISKINFSFYYH